MTPEGVECLGQIQPYGRTIGVELQGAPQVQGGALVISELAERDSQELQHIGIIGSRAQQSLIRRGGFPEPTRLVIAHSRLQCALSGWINRSHSPVSTTMDGSKTGAHLQSEPESLLTLARQEMAAGHLQAAQAKCLQVLGTHQRHAGALSLLGRILSMQGRQEEAVQVFNAVTLGLETSPKLVAEGHGFLHYADRTALGIFVAAAALKSFIAFAPAGVPRLDEIQLNATALAGAVGIAGVAMLLFGLAPAIMTSRVELQRALRSDSRQSGSRRSRFVTEALVAGQVALALVVLSGAGLIAKSLVKLQGAELSLEPSRLLIGELAVRDDQHDDAAKQRALLERLLPQLRTIPGVRGVSPVVAVPFAGSAAWDGRPAAEGQSQEESAANPMLNMDVVAPDYFKTLGIPVLRGRGFTDADRADAPAVVVVSESAARHYWPSQDPIGKRLRMGADLERTVTVIGVVPDTRYRDLREARPSIYFPLRQSVFPFAPLALAIRTSGPPDELVSGIRRVISETEPGVALTSAASFETYLDGPLAQPRLNALLLAVFAGAAVVLAAVGLFGAMATMVRQRTRELGVRMALGANAGDLRRMVMGRGLAIAATGSVLGLLGALLANRLLQGLLYDVTPTDLATLTAVTGFLIVVAAVASLIPARATTRIDPVVALKAE